MRGKHPALSGEHIARALAITARAHWDQWVFEPGGIRLRLSAGPAGEMRWRLLAGNGRVLAVAPESYDDADLAEKSFVALTRSARALVASIKHPESSVEWTWTALDAAGAPVAKGERSYARYGTCASSFDRFRKTITALTDDDVRVLFRRLEPDKQAQ